MSTKGIANRDFRHAPEHSVVENSNAIHTCFFSHSRLCVRIGHLEQLVLLRFSGGSSRILEENAE